MRCAATILLVDNAGLEESAPNIVIGLSAHLKRIELHRHPLYAVAEQIKRSTAD
jgi:hypothetical protein